MLKDCKKAGVIVIVTVLAAFAEMAVIPYISPGIMIGFGKVISPSITTKITIGINTPVLHFVNLTYGRVFTLRTNVPQLKGGLRFLEVESGMIITVPPVFPFVAGGGAGVTFHNRNGVKISPKMSLFCGSMVFFRTDLFLYPELKSHAIWNHGLMLVAPVSPLFFDWD
jgi:hypothetical protein